MIHKNKALEVFCDVIFFYLSLAIFSSMNMLKKIFVKSFHNFIITFKVLKIFAVFFTVKKGIYLIHFHTSALISIILIVCNCE